MKKRTLVWTLLMLAAVMLAAPVAMAVPCVYTGSDIGLYPAGIGFNANVCYNLPNYAQSPNIRKFIDKLPGLGPANANNLGQYVSVAVPDTTSYPGSDYYEVGIRQFSRKVHTDMPPTTFRGYYSKLNSAPTDSNQYLGATIVARKNRPVRIKYFNELPTGAAGNLFLPVDTNLMGAGAGPTAGVNFTQNRAALHLHGGRTPWISDGTPYQWITPAADPVAASGGPVYQKGASFQNVPDMVNGSVVNGVAVPCIGGAKCFTPAVADGTGTVYYTNDQSARLMFYHDHAMGITRLNVYAGGAAGYLLTSQAEDDLITGSNLSGANPLGKQVLPDLGGVYHYGIPLVIQDKSFVNDATTPTPPGFPAATSGYVATSMTRTTDPLWFTYVTPAANGGSLWLPHEYLPIENIFDPTGGTWNGKWDYGPFLNPPVVPQHTTLPSPSIVPESFMDTAFVNGTAFPYLELPPDAIRFRILSVGNDRGFNLSWFKADPIRINVTNGGANYSANPTVTISGNAGTYTSAQAIVSPGTIIGIDVPDAQHYIFPPTVTLTGGGGTCARVFATVVSNSSGAISVTANGCTGFTSPPTVTLTGGGGGTYTPPAIATIIPKGVITGIVVNGAAGYRSDLPVPTVSITDTLGSGAAATAFVNTEVAMVPAAFGTSDPNYPSWPGDMRDGGVPDPAAAGPSWVQIGNESGFLAQAAVWPPNPIVYEQNRQSIPTLGVTYHSLLLQPAMRADVVVDFSAYKDGDVLILYNDSGAPMPGFWPTNDYYTDDPDQTGVGSAPSTPAGFGPNTRTVMQVRIKGTKTSAFNFNLAELQAALPAAFAADQDKPIVPQLAYNAAYPGFATFDAYAQNLDTTLNLTGVGQPISRIVTALGGNGYSTPPTVTILPQLVAPVHTNATATAGLNAMGGITLLTAGSGYTTPPTVTIGTPASTGTTGGGVTASAIATISGGKVTALAINEPGSNYSLTTAPTCTISGGGGTGATCSNFVAVAGTVGSITLTNPGSGYLSEPLVFITGGGGGVGAAADALLNGAVAMTGKNITEGFDVEYGRLDIRLGSTPNALTPNVGNGQVIGIARYIDPPTEILRDGEAILWRITHLGVDSHSLHFHLFDMQIVNHVDFTNVVKPPYPDELGWREVIRTNPLEDIIVAIRPRTMALPFPVPRSSRLLDVSNLVNVNTNFLPIAPPLGIPAVPQITNSITDFGWEYVWHCHLLAHEENDMMRPMCLQPPTVLPATAVLAVPGVSAGQVSLSWTQTVNASFTNQVASFMIRRCSGSTTCTPADFAPVSDRTARTFVDTTILPSTIYRYRVRAINNAGNGPLSGIQTVTTTAFGNPTVTMDSPANGATYTAPATIPLLASATTGTGATIANVGFYFGTNLISTATTSPYTVNWASVPVGVYSVTAKVTNSQGATAVSAPITVNVEPVAGGPAPSVFPASLTFGAQIVNTLSTAQTVTLINIGGSALTINSISIGGVNLGQFTQTNNCPASLGAGLSCAAQVTFAPNWIIPNGAMSAYLGINVADAGLSQSVPLSGTVVAAIVAPASLTFGNQTVNTSSTAQTVTLTNTSAVAIAISSISIGGANNGQFTQTNNCPASLGAGLSCTAQVTFAPNWITPNGAMSASLDVIVPAGTTSVPLNGTVVPVLMGAPASLAFGLQTVNTLSIAKTVTVTNTSAAPAAITSISIGGTNNAQFTQTNNCPASLGAGLSCAVQVTFAPNWVNAMNATVDVNNVTVTTLTGTSQ